MATLYRRLTSIDALARATLLLAVLLSISTRADDAPERGPAETNYDVELPPPANLPIPTTIDGAGGQWRHPAAIVLTSDDRYLCVANRRSATLSLMDLNDRSRDGVYSIGGRLEAMVRLSDERLAVADGENDRVVLFRLDGGKVDQQVDVAVVGEPRQLVASRAGDMLWASLRSGRAVAAMNTKTTEKAFRRELDFAPHCLSLSEDESTLLVADAFRGQIAALNARTGDLLASRTFPGTNIRGLAFEPGDKSFIFAHQIISERSIIERELVRWGAFITNNVRRVAMDVFLDPSANVATKTELHFVGDFANGAGDPGKLMIPSRDLAVLCLSGVNEVAVDTHWPYRMSRIRVGRHPVDAAVDSKGRRVYVLNQFDDSISVVDPIRRAVVETITLGKTPAETAEIRGEILFHDASLSLDDWYSCQSCHTDGHTNGSNADTFGDGGHGSPKNTPSLLGVAGTKPWSWTGRFDRLADQIDSTIEHTMQSRLTSSSKSSDLAAYLSTLEPRQSPAGTIRSDEEPIAAGRAVFEKRGCVQCHAGKVLTSDAVFDVGLNDGIAGNKEFNPPSLRGVAATAPYFHDGRTSSLDEAIRRHPGPMDDPPIPEEDVIRLLAYLKSL